MSYGFNFQFINLFIEVMKAYGDVWAEHEAYKYLPVRSGFRVLLLLSLSESPKAFQVPGMCFEGTFHKKDIHSVMCPA